MTQPISPILDAVELLTEAERLQAENRPDQAIALYRAWLANTSSPLAYAAYFNLGVALSDAQDFAGSEQVYREALRCKPDFIQAHLNLGTLLERVGRTEEALMQWRQVLKLDSSILSRERPLHLQALNNLARLLEITRQFQEAEQLLTQSLTLDPNQPHALQHWIHLRQKQCEWPIYACDKLSSISKERMQQATSALSALSAFDDPAMLLTASRRFVTEKVPLPGIVLADPEGYAHAKLRIGYLSSDFCLHPVALLTAELFELHDRSKVEVYGFCWSREDGSAVRRRIIGAMDRYVRIVEMTDEEAARCIRSHEIDILVDLHGLTSGVRPAILAYKPAPVQITYLGYPGTTAMPSIDYVIADKFVLPENLTPYFSEKPLYLPNVFQISDRQRIADVADTGDLSPNRASCGLPDDVFVFCSFNNNYKFTEEVFTVWMRILQRVPHSVLWLLADNPWAQENLCQAAKRQGIDSSRLIFASRVSPQQYLARYRLADLFLDTTPFNAGTTANDALWMGLPLLTCAGRTFSSRMAGSLLQTLGLPELIVNSLEEYEDKAAHLASDPVAIASLKRRLQEQRASSPLFDTPQLVRNLEEAYERVYIGKYTRKDTPMDTSVLSDPAAAILATNQHREHIQAALNRFPGPQYLDWLQWLHRTLKPASYVEIGVETGQSLQFARSPTKSVGIDPALGIVFPQECWVKLFKLTSDDFFEHYDLRQVLEAQHADFAFIDGLHSFDQALKDFLYIERYAHPGTVVAFHDIFPVTPLTAERDRKTIFWVGDTWKAVLILKQMRPDLKLFTIPTFPSGLTLVSGLDSNRVLPARDLEQIIERWMPVELASYMTDIDTHLNVVENAFEPVLKLLKRNYVV